MSTAHTHTRPTSNNSFAIPFAETPANGLADLKGGVEAGNVGVQAGGGALQLGVLLLAAAEGAAGLPVGRLPAQALLPQPVLRSLGLRRLLLHALLPAPASQACWPHCLSDQPCLMMSWLHQPGRLDGFVAAWISHAGGPDVCKEQSCIPQRPSLPSCPLHCNSIVLSCIAPGAVPL